MDIRIRYLLNSLYYLVQTIIFRKQRPFIAGIVLNNECNLKCLHCGLDQSAHRSLSFAEIEQGLDQLLALGIRSGAITGGEPFIWHDGKSGINDVIQLMYQKDVQVTSVYTNGTFPINTLADNVFVSIDGTEQTTNKLRGPVFAKVLENIQQSKHPKIFVNFTINRENTGEIEAFCQFAKTIPQIKGIFFYFHTPYYGIDQLYQTREERVAIAQLLLRLKTKYTILNSKAALNDFINDRWERPSKVC